LAHVRCQISVSADGYAAGPNQSVENPLGEGGEALHEWVVKLAAWRRPHGREGGEVNASTPVMEEATANVGAVVMGRGMFGGGPGPWGEPAWTGWWGEEPPFRMPVFVLTHHAREPLVLGETTFHFVTDGVERAVELALEAADGGDVSIGGGAATVQQVLRAGLLDELTLNQVPLLLGDGARLLDGLGGIELRQTRVIEGPDAAHVTYAVGRPS
jgi:dihydrofolate reductase